MAFCGSSRPGAQKLGIPVKMCRTWKDTGEPPRRTADAIVVLGCRLHPDGSPSGALSRRLAVAAAAFESGQAPVVIASGGRAWGPQTEAVGMRQALIRQGVPEAQIWLEACSLTTLENAWYTRQLADRRNVQSVVVVTCDFHMPRALAAFESVGLSSVGAAAATPGGVSWTRALRERLSALLDGV